MRARINTEMQLAPPAARPDAMFLIQPFALAVNLETRAVDNGSGLARSLARRPCGSESCGRGLGYRHGAPRRSSAAGLRFDAGADEIPGAVRDRSRWQSPNRPAGH